jgi:hypothetical protein
MFSPLTNSFIIGTAVVNNKLFRRGPASPQSLFSCPSLSLEEEEKEEERGGRRRNKGIEE